MLDPKWLVGAFALGALALILSYDLRIGLTVGMAVIRIKLAAGPGEPTSEREAMFERFSRSSRNREKAQSKQQAPNLGPERGPDAG